MPESAHFSDRSRLFGLQFWQFSESLRFFIFRKFWRQSIRFRESDFFVRNGWHGFIILGSVFLVVTGGEALYADMGHFGAKPIRLAWFTIVLPALFLNYFGQGALLLENPEFAGNPFYNLAPEWALYPLIILATMAAVIASQAVISGAFSLTMQAVQLGFIPRLKINHTSIKEYGQIYLPIVNWALMIGCILTVLAFQTFEQSRRRLRNRRYFDDGYHDDSFLRRRPRALELVVFCRPPLLCVIFLIIDIAFFGANIIKFFDGGWFPLVLAVIIFLVMMTWKKGRSLLQKRIQEETQPLEDFLYDIGKKNIARVPGTAVFMNGNASRTPTAILQNIKHNKILHERVLFVTVKTRPIPYVDEDERIIF